MKRSAFFILFLAVLSGFVLPHKVAALTAVPDAFDVPAEAEEAEA